MNQKELGQKNYYRVKVKETLNRSIANLIGEITVEPQDNGETILTGLFIDQPALRGFLDQLWNLNFTILSLERIDPQNIQEFLQASEGRRQQ